MLTSRLRTRASLFEELDDFLTNRWCVFRRLEDHGVAFEQAGAEHPERHGEGEVPRRDDGRHAPGLAAHVGVLLRDFRGEHIAHRHPAGAEDVLNHVEAFDDLGPAFGDDLTALAGHELGEFVGVPFDELGQVVEQLGPANPAGATPGGECCPRGGDRLVGFLDASQGKGTDHLAPVGGVMALERLRS